jgi:hypothetical protein
MYENKGAAKAGVRYQVSGARRNLTRILMGGDRRWEIQNSR